MTATPVSLYRARSEVTVGGEAVTVMYGPVVGGIITNPATIADQGIPVLEVLYVDPTGASATLFESATTVAIQPGQSYFVPAQTTDVSVNAATSTHQFSAVAFQLPTQPAVPQQGDFPPDGPTTLTLTIPSYLYQQYDDDDDLEAFVGSFNALAQGYVTWFATASLPVYTEQSGALLDWVALGLYGMKRPALSSGRNRDIGPYNTAMFNQIAFNRRIRVGPKDVTVTSDDVFKRIMTWNFYKGDGNVFNVRWLKRRVMRFLIGANGSAPNIDQTYPVSVTYGPGVIAIKLGGGSRTITGGALFNRHGFNRVPFNSLQTVFASGPNPLPFESVLKQALDSGVLTLPFQYEFTITI